MLLSEPAPTLRGVSSLRHFFSAALSSRGPLVSNVERGIIQHYDKPQKQIASEFSARRRLCGGVVSPYVSEGESVMLARDETRWTDQPRCRRSRRSILLPGCVRSLWLCGVSGRTGAQGPGGGGRCVRNAASVHPLSRWHLPSILGLTY